MSEKNHYIYVEPEPYSTDILAMLRSYFPEKNLKVVVPESREDLKTEAKEAGFFCSVICEEKTAHVVLDGSEYEYVYSGEEFSDVPEDEDTISGSAFKKGLGAWFYRVLREKTGRDLPWGNLNGVRPTKPAFCGLDKGDSEETIRAYYEKEHYVSRGKTDLALDIAGRELEILQQVSHPEGATQADPHGYTKGYSLYIGIPFCPTTCLYCSFTSFPIAAYRKEAEHYIDCLIREMEATADLMKDYVLDSVYIGGGTPTTLEPDQLDRMLTALHHHFSFETVREFTVEAGRADSITREKLEVLKKHGVSRISINSQTMKQETLDFIGRKATVQQVLEAYPVARELGFDNINMDLILGLPGEDEGDVAETMRQVKALAPDSLTIHSLAIKRASRLAQWIEQNGMPVAGNTDRTMEIAMKGAEEMGLKPYYLYRQKNMSGNFENVGYAAPGKYGLYNILIMEEVQSIVALGAGTITKRAYPDGRLERCENVKDVKLYMDQLEEMILRKKKLFED